MAIFTPANTGDTTQHEFAAEDAALVLANLIADDLFISGLVSRDVEAASAEAGLKRAINVRHPATLIARGYGADDKDTALVLDEIKESYTPVVLDTLAASGVSLSPQNLDADITDFAAQVLAPQATAVVDYIEHAVAAELSKTTLDTTIAWNAANPVKTFTALRKKLRDSGVGGGDLVAVVGTDVYAALLDADAITHADKAGDSMALREGAVGRVRGFIVAESPRVGEGEIIAYHRRAAQLVVRAPMVPAGAPYGASVSERGVALTHLRSYDPIGRKDISTVEAFVGVAVLPIKRAVRDYAAGTVTVQDAPAAIRMSITDAEPTP